MKVMYKTVSILLIGALMTTTACSKSKGKKGGADATPKTEHAAPPKVTLSASSNPATSQGGYNPQFHGAKMDKEYIAEDERSIPPTATHSSVRYLQNTKNPGMSTYRRDKVHTASVPPTLSRPMHDDVLIAGQKKRERITTQKTATIETPAPAPKKQMPPTPQEQAAPAPKKQAPPVAQTTKEQLPTTKAPLATNKKYQT